MENLLVIIRLRENMLTVRCKLHDYVWVFYLVILKKEDGVQYVIWDLMKKLYMII